MTHDEKIFSLPQNLYTNLDKLLFTTQIKHSKEQKIYQEYSIKPIELILGPSYSDVYCNIWKSGKHDAIIPVGNPIYQSDKPYYDKNLLQSFIKINTNDIAQVLDWTRKYGLLINHECKYFLLQDFKEEHRIIKQLFDIICAIGTYFEGNTSLLKSLVTYRKFSDILRLKIDTIKMDEHYYLMYSKANQIEQKFYARPYPDVIKDVSTHLNNDNEYIILFSGEPVGNIFDINYINSVDEPLICMALLALGTVIWEKIGPAFSISWGTVITNDNDYFPYTLNTEIKCNDLLRMLYFQLAWLISPYNTLRKCKYCGKPFVPEGQRPGKQIYCTNCGSYAAQNKYKKDKRITEYYKKGLTFEEIANKLNVAIDYVTNVLSSTSKKEGD